MDMSAHIVSTGDEVLTGKVVDANAAYIADQLTMAGIAVVRHTCVGDDLETLADTFREAGAQAEVVVVTGGLGPTSDDLTAEAAALATGQPLVFDTRAFEGIVAFFEGRGFPMRAGNKKQAYFPNTAQFLPNPVGTAPGFCMVIGKALCFFLPGVPLEMRRMMDEQVLPEILRRRGNGVVRPVPSIITTFGLPESEAGERLQDFSTLFPDLRLGFQVKFPEVWVKIYPGARLHETIEPRMEEAGNWVQDRLGRRVLSSDGQSMPAVIGTLLRKRGETLAVAESCTGGLVAHLLTEVAGSSDYFLFSAITYANQAKISVLNVSAKTLEANGAVAEQTAAEMAVGARTVSGATWAIATTGIAGPGGGSPEKPVGTVCVAIAGPLGVSTRRRVFPFADRSMNKQMFAVSALDMLRRILC